MIKYLLTAAFVLTIQLMAPVQHLKADVPEARDAALKLFRQEFSNRYFMHPSYHTSTLAEGEEATVRIPIFRGNQYVIAVVGDAGLQDVDLYTYDEGGDRWAFDTDKAPFAAVTKKARWTGYIFIRVHAAKGSGSVCVVTGHR
ncbi:MAG: hypothetical protein ACAI35_14995 [Candidatus Methylacidiphilales bacterium]|nr:hypothetical protein [Candidatus Methylacidiphilales bacterium]